MNCMASSGPDGARQVTIRILLVEDDVADRRHTLRLIDRLPHPTSCDAVGSLEAARVALLSKTYDIALLDQHLPDGFGTDLLEDIGTTGSTHWRKTYLLTAIPEHVQRANNLGNPPIVCFSKADLDADLLEGILADCIDTH